MDPTRTRSTASSLRIRASPGTGARSRRSESTTRRWSRRSSTSTPTAPACGSTAARSRPRPSASSCASRASRRRPMEDLLAYLARQLVDHPDDVRVERYEGASGELVLELHVAADDVGKVIGKQGRIARAL